MALFCEVLFQSHAGSIEASQSMARINWKSEGFNPTLVRLRHSSILSAQFDAVVFQSHAGSIEARYSPRLAYTIAKFQSHAGSIEASRIRRGDWEENSFQSHAGSIEASWLPPAWAVVLRVSIPRWFD